MQIDKDDLFWLFALASKGVTAKADQGKINHLGSIFGITLELQALKDTCVCTCCLKQRAWLQTEQAWRKRAEEAENKLAQVFTYTNQPTDNVDAWRLGEAANNAVNEPAGDLIDRGLSLLKALQEKGYGIILQ